MTIRQPHLVSSRSRGVKFCSACRCEFRGPSEQLSSAFAQHVRREHRQDPIQAATKHIAKSAQLQRDAAVAGLHFITVDLDTALTFTRIALDPKCGPATKARNRMKARKAYDTVLHFIEKLSADEHRTSELHRRLTRLRSELEELGEILT